MLSTECLSQYQYGSMGYVWSLIKNMRMSGMTVRCPKVRSMHNIKVTITDRGKISDVAVEGEIEKTHNAEELFIETKVEAQNEETHVTGIRVEADGRASHAHGFV